MRIESIQLNAFRSYAGQNFETNAPFVVVSGENGTGKTTLRDAIMWALTGSTCELSGKGASGELLRPSFTETAQPVAASVVLPQIGRVERTWQEQAGQALRVTNWTGNLTTQQTALYDHLKAHEGLVRVLCDARAFLRLDHTEAKELLLGVLNVVIQAPVGKDDALVPYTLAELDAAYAQAFTDRKVAKKVLAGCVVPNAPESKNYRPVEEYEARLVTLRADLSEMQRAIGGTVAKRQALTDQIHSLKAKIEVVLRRNALRESLTASITEAEAQLQSMPEEVGAVSAERLAFLRSRTEALSAHDPKGGCVLDAGVPCKTAKKAFEGLSATYQAELDAAAVANPQSSARAGLLRRIESDKADLARFVAEETSALESEVEALTAELGSLPAIDEAEAAIAAKAGHIQKGQTITSEARAYFAAVESHQKALQAKQAAAGEVERLERLCDILGPSGVRVQALQAALAGFLEQVNPRMAAWGWTLDFKPDPWKVLVNGREVQTFSLSERFRIGVALQIAIAKVSGLSFIVVDEFDILDPDNNRLTGKMIAQSRLDQVFMLRTRGVNDPLPQAQGVIAFRLGKRDGRSVITEKVEGGAQ